MRTESSNTSGAWSAVRTAGRVAALALAATCLLASSSWIVSGEWYEVDLLANLGAQVLLVCVVSALVLAAFRRWAALAIVLAACGMQAWPLLGARAALWPRNAGLSPATGSEQDPDVVRMLHYNDSCLSDKRLVYDLMERSGADVLSILCPPVSMQAEVNYGPGLEDIYPGKLTREWGPGPDQILTEITACILVSRWPMDRADTSMAGPLGAQILAGIVRRPDGPFAVVCVHPRSPRTPERWREGNLLVEATASVVNALRDRGLPVVVLTDLNATPTGWRSRWLCGATGLRHTKPLLQAEGTFPRFVPLNIRTNRKSGVEAWWPLTIVIDDALVSPEIGVVSWKTSRHLASEHKPVHVAVRIPRVGTSGANRTDR